MSQQADRRTAAARTAIAKGRAARLRIGVRRGLRQASRGLRQASRVAEAAALELVGDNEGAPADGSRGQRHLVRLCWRVAWSLLLLWESSRASAHHPLPPYCLLPPARTCHMDMILGECVCALSLINKTDKPSIFLDADDRLGSLTPARGRRRAAPLSQAVFDCFCILFLFSV